MAHHNGPRKKTRYKFKKDQRKRGILPVTSLIQRFEVGQKVHVFDAAYSGERMAAYLFLPKKGSPPFQTVVLFPGSNAIHTRSSASLTPGALFVLKSGRALLHPVYKSTFERGDGLVSDYPDETSNWKDHVVMWGKDIRRSIDYLETRGDVDTGRLAFMGYSWGAAMGPIMMAVDPRFKAGVVVVAGLNFQHALPEVDEVHYAPRVRIPVLMLNGKYNFVHRVEDGLNPFFNILGTPLEDKVRRIYDTDLPPRVESRPTRRSASSGFSSREGSGRTSRRGASCSRRAGPVVPLRGSSRRARPRATPTSRRSSGPASRRFTSSESGRWRRWRRSRAGSGAASGSASG